jgi:hypothetical protein
VWQVPGRLRQIYSGRTLVQVGRTEHKPLRARAAATSVCIRLGFSLPAYMSMGDHLKLPSFGRGYGMAMAARRKGVMRQRHD